MEGFLRQFVDEMKSLYENGINVGDTNVAVTIRCFILDTPARAHIKGNVEFQVKFYETFNRI